MHEMKHGRASADVIQLPARDLSPSPLLSVHIVPLLHQIGHEALKPRFYYRSCELHC